MMNPETVKNVAPFAPLALPFINALIESHLKPRLAQLYSESSVERQVYRTRFEEYLQRSYARQHTISSVVLRGQTKLDDIYIPLTLVEDTHTRQKEKVVVNNYPEALLSKSRKILIKDTAGMGKSTLTKYMFLRCIEQNGAIPILVELRKLSKSKNIIDAIYEDINAVDSEINKEAFLRLIRLGGFVFFFDGYDEVPFEERENVTENLQEFVAKAGNNQFIITSRPEGALQSFTDFHHFVVQPLTQDEAFQLITKYGSDSESSRNLIRELSALNSKGKKDGYREFLGNPLLVSLLYKAYEWKPTIPQKKHTFYRQVYDALFEGHDLTKPGTLKRQKHSGLDIDDFEKILRPLGFMTLKHGIQYEKSELIEHIKDAKQQCPEVEFQPNDLLKDLITTVPLFTAEGTSYRWNHKSIQEYFAALYICRDAHDNQENLLRAMVQKDIQKYENVLDICYDMDYKAFRNSVLSDLISDFIEFYDKEYLAIDHGLIPEREINVRKSLTFNFESLIFFPNPLIRDFLHEWDNASTDRETEGRDELEQDDGLGYVMSRIGQICDTERRYFYNHYSMFSSDDVEEANDPEGLLNDMALATRTKRSVAALIGLLYRKGGPLVKKEWEIYGPEKGERPQVLLKDFTDVGEVEYEPDKPVIIDDNPNSFINHPDLFHLINILILRYGQSGSDLRGVLDIKACRALKAQIEQDLETQTNTATLMGYL